VKWTLLLALTCAFSLCAESQSKPAGAQLPELPKIRYIRVSVKSFEVKSRARSERPGLQPRNPEAAGLLAMTLHCLPAVRSSRPSLRTRIAARAAEFRLHYLRGAVQVELGEFSAAVESFRSALRLRPHDWPQVFVCRRVWPRWLSGTKRRAAYRRILDEHRDFAQAWYGLGRVQAAQGDSRRSGAVVLASLQLVSRIRQRPFCSAAELRRLGVVRRRKSMSPSTPKIPALRPPLDDPLFKRIHELNQGTQVHLRRGTEFEKAGLLEERNSRA